MAQKKHIKLNQIYATAICGNDILSSALYVSGIAIIFAGVLAPFVLLFIAGVLFLYKAVYTEVVEALPINGGAYNCLLNGTSKAVAAVAGITTFLSYIATAVISAKIGIEYLHTIVAVPVIPTTIALLAFFALLVITGLKDSAKVALVIFAFHIFALVSFIVLGFFAINNGLSYFQFNLNHTFDLFAQRGGLMNTFFLAFAASLLGVSGFESSANFVEEQHEGVFRKTLRNMLIGVAIFNPIIALIVLNVMPFQAIAGARDFLLSNAAFVIGGTLFQQIIVLDAFFVLSGAVLASYIGVSGLLARMTGDNCLPSYFAKKSSNGSYTRIVLAFFLLCTSILLLTQGNLLSLAGVYTIAFLGVMSLFAFGNLILKATRAEIKRTYQAPVIVVLFAFCLTLIGIVGNIKIDFNNFAFFIYYFIPSVVIVLLVIYQDNVLRALLHLTRHHPRLHYYIRSHFDDLIEGKFVVFVHHASRLYKILNYINRNETGRTIYLICCRSNDETDVKKNYHAIVESLPYLHKSGVFPHLDIHHHFKDQPFGPDVIDEVSKEFKVRKNRILIGSIHHSHHYDYSDLGGVRIIF